MKKLFLAFAVIFSVIINAQTAKEIIDKNIELTGGLTNWKLLNSVLLQGRVTLGVNDEYPIKIYQQRPNLTKTTITIGKKETAVEGFEAKYLGKEKVGEIYCHKVELTKNVNKTMYFFDSKSYMLLKEVKKDETLEYSDFRMVGALTMPFRIESSSPKKDSDYVMILNKIETNRVFPANTFKF